MVWHENEVTKNIVEKKYLHENERTFEDMVSRVSSIYKDSVEAKNAMSAGDIFPAGRTLYGAGRKGKQKLTLSNCYILPTPEDTLESICKVDYEMSKIGSMGGGVGLALDNIRPKGSKINNSAKVSDGVSFCLRKYNETGEQIGQNNRKMAIMVALTCSHPDIEEFLHIKENEEKLSAMNISIKFDDKFMEAVDEDGEYELYFKTPHEEIKKKIKAKRFFEEFCKVNADWGDPGAIFIDRVRGYNLLNGYKDYQIDVSNPCVTGDTLILTDCGYKRIDSLVGKSCNVWNGYQYSRVSPRITGYNQKMIRVYTSNGMSLDCTLYHKFVLSNGDRIKASELSIGDKLKKWEYPIVDGFNTLSNAYTKGFYSGDGTEGREEIALYADKMSLIDRIAHSGFNTSCDRILCRLVPDSYDKSFVPDNTYSIASRLEWLSGIVDSDGTRNSKDGSISITSVNREFLSKVQLMLTTLGTHSTISISRESGDRLMPKNNGTGEYGYYKCKDCYRLSISAFYIKKLIDLGFTTYRVDLSNINPNRNAQRFVTIVDIEAIPDSNIVYCFNEPINHTGIFNGIMTAQCAEFFGNGYNSCNLESINLYNCIKNKFEDNAEIDFDKLEKLTRLGVRMLNDCLDYGRDMQPLDGNKKCIDKWRSIGLGVFGVADALIAMKIKYGSKEAFNFISDVFNHINIVSLDESCNIAKETKPFSMYDWSKTKESPIIQALLLSKEGKKVYNKIKKYGLANGTLLSIAPNGSISLMAGKLSGGIEPLFKIGYDRTTHSGEDKGVVFRVFARSVEDLLSHKGLPMTLTNEEIKKMFPWIVESQDIAPIDRISMQAITQEYVDNAISSTINLPPETGWKKIYEIYLNAWRQKLKGVTVFVDGCKRGNLLGVTKNGEDKKQEFDYIEPVNRRGVKEIASVTSRSKTACVPKFYTHVSKTDDGHVFEVFTNTSAGCTSNQNTITRLVSLALRSGIKVDEIIKELRANKCPACQALKRRGEKDIADSCGSVVANAIESAYNKDLSKSVEKRIETKESTDVVIKIKQERVCPECKKSGTIVPEAHCWVCSSCGASGCN